MRLRRVELVIIGITLAFICFMGGFFVGRNLTSVNMYSVNSGDDRGNHSNVQVQFNDKYTDEEVSENGDKQPEQVSSSSKTPEPAQIEVSTTTDQSLDTTNVEQFAVPQSVDDGKININKASQSELTELPGVGNAIAGRIIDYREQKGSYTSIEDLMNVSGIGEKKFTAIKDLVSVG